jgi:nucleoside-diphosphate-sugar epimerase
MKVAVTGATGFVGRHVLLELSKREGIEVVAVARRAPTKLELPPGIRAAALDIADGSDGAFDALGRPDRLIHLAWSGLPHYRSLHHFEEQLPQQYRFLAGLLRSGLSSLLVAGTCFEYGMASGPLVEDRPTAPDNPYGYAKDALRRQLELLQASHAFELVWARLFYMHGQGQNASSIYPQLAAAARRGDAEFPMSSGEQLRDFLPVTEVARRLVALALDAPDAGIVNVCSGRPVSVRALVEGWIREQNWAIEPVLDRCPYPDYEPIAFWGSNAKLRQRLPSLWATESEK